LKIGTSQSTFTPDSLSSGSVSDQFDGSFNINGSVSFQITADLRSNFTGNATVQLNPISLGDFNTAEYLSNGNPIDGNQLIGSLSTVNVNVQGSTLSLSRNDGLTDRSVVR